jgi:hypothetical protein
MTKRKALRVTAAVAGSFIVLVGAIVLLLLVQKVSIQVAMLMFVALVAMYIGFGFLTAVYRLVDKLE